ncbi:MAG: acetyl-CoA C-acyltransferase [Anaerolineales bacterium]|nr:acetyl-CoA C-acyltransferase [Chloroflexota bacterium]MBL6982362.1 acetyl-CoA C-acyltransferase [Anaerolineales bacterium]
MSKRDPQYDPVIVAAARTPVGRAKRGSLATVRPEDMAAAVIKELLKRADPLNPEEIDDVIIGCAFPEGEQGMNMSRLIGFRAGLPVSVPTETINRFCSSGLQSIAHAAMAIMAGQIDVAIAGGVESMTMVPMTGYHFAPSPHLAAYYPEAFTSMGLTAENVAEKYGVSREDQDKFALRSHTLANEAVTSGRFDEELVPMEVEIVEPGSNGQPKTKTFTFKRDEGPRADTSLEALGKLRAVFKEGGTVTAGTSSQMSDGSAGVVIMSKAKADELGLKPLARFISFGVAGVPPEIMGIGPVEAIPKALKIAGMSQDEIQLIELNEAFAAQGLAVMRELGLSEEITNVNGGAIALGHPLGATGAKLTVQLLFEMKRRELNHGMVSMCIGGGMGAAGIFENLN